MCYGVKVFVGWERCGASAEHAADMRFKQQTSRQGLWAQWAGACRAGRLIGDVGVDAFGAVGVALHTLLGLLEGVVTDAAGVQVCRRDQEEFKRVSWHG